MADWMLEAPGGGTWREDLWALLGKAQPGDTLRVATEEQRDVALERWRGLRIGGTLNVEITADASVEGWATETVQRDRERREIEDAWLRAAQSIRENLRPDSPFPWLDDACRGEGENPDRQAVTSEFAGLIKHLESRGDVRFGVGTVHHSRDWTDEIIVQPSASPDSVFEKREENMKPTPQVRRELIKPCPFCGEAKEKFLQWMDQPANEGRDRILFMRCSSCGASGPTSTFSATSGIVDGSDPTFVASIIQTWNRRSAS